MLQCLLLGQVEFMCDPTTHTTPRIKGGKVKAYAVTTRTQVPSLANLPLKSEIDKWGPVIRKAGVYAD